MSSGGKYFDDWIENKDNLEDLNGKTALITGVSSEEGLGYWTTYGLMKKGALCLITSRDQTKGDAMKKSLEAKMEGKGKPVSVLKMDNLSFKSVNECCDTIKNDHKKLDIIITNAGRMFGDYKFSTDGWEEQIQTNHLAHFLLIRNLFPLIKKAADNSDGFKPTITQVSSYASEYGNVTVHPDNLNAKSPSMDWMGSFLGRFISKDLESMKRYAQSKMANVLCARELAKKIEDAGLGEKIISNSCHPGGCKTHLQKDGEVGAVTQYFLNMVCHAPADGSLPSIMAAASPNRQSGAFYGPNSTFYGYPVMGKSTNRNLFKPDLAKEFWEASEKAVGVKFEV